MTTPNQVFSAVALAFGVPSTFYRDHTRTEWLSLARFAAWHIIREKVRHMSLEQIALLSGKRHHTSIVHGTRRAAELLKNDREFKQAYDEALDHLLGMPAPTYITTIYT